MEKMKLNATRNATINNKKAIMYLVRIEPVYSQGVGYYELITDNIRHINKFRNELVRYKNHLKNEDEDEGENDLDDWEFYEYVYKLTDYSENSNTYNGYCLYNKVYSGDFDDSELVKLGANDLDKLEEERDKSEEKEFEEFEYDNVVLLNYVYNYNYIDTTIKPKHVNNFDILTLN